MFPLSEVIVFDEKSPWEKPWEKIIDYLRKLLSLRSQISLTNSPKPHEINKILKIRDYLEEFLIVSLPILLIRAGGRVAVGVQAWCWWPGTAVDRPARDDSKEGWGISWWSRGWCLWPGRQI